MSFVKLSPVLLLHLFGQLRIAARAAPDRPFDQIHLPPEVREPGRARGRVDRDDQRQHGQRAVGGERRPVLGDQYAGVRGQVFKPRAGQERGERQDRDGQPEGDGDRLLPCIANPAPAFAAIAAAW